MTVPRKSPAYQGRNRLLFELPHEEYVTMLPHLEPVLLTRGMMLHRQGETVDFVYFPEGGLCSMAHTLENGHVVVVATVGEDGIVAPMMLSRSLPMTATIVQVGGTSGLRMRHDAFRSAMGECKEFFDRVTRSSLSLVESIIRTAACNRSHTVYQRLARWLLLLRTRLNTNEIPVTHDALAMMLGVRRASITIAARSLHVSGWIRCQHRRIVITQPAALEAAACECSRVDTFLLPTASLATVPMSVAAEPQRTGGLVIART